MYLMATIAEADPIPSAESPPHRVISSALLESLLSFLASVCVCGWRGLFGLTTSANKQTGGKCSYSEGIVQQKITLQDPSGSKTLIMEMQIYSDCAPYM